MELREKEIRDLTRQANQLEEKLNDVGLVTILFFILSLIFIFYNLLSKTNMNTSASLLKLWEK